MDATSLEGSLSTPIAGQDQLKGRLTDEARILTDKLAFVFTLRELSTLGVPVPELIRLANAYNATRARPNYLVDTFVVQNPDGSYSKVDVRSGQVKPKEPYDILPRV